MDQAIDWKAIRVDTDEKNCSECSESATGECKNCRRALCDEHGPEVEKYHLWDCPLYLSRLTKEDLDFAWKEADENYLKHQQAAVHANAMAHRAITTKAFISVALRMKRDREGKS